MIQRTLHPAWYHGRRARRPFFEGWYYKLIDATEQRRYAIIPGVFLGTEDDTSHAFVQVLDGTAGTATYHTYPLDAFRAAENAFDVHVGPNHFALDHIHLQLDTADHRISGEVNFAGLTPWPVTLGSPGAMGWYAWVPRMQCYHGILSLDHTIHGALSIGDETTRFTGGRGYIEKDWGHSFPSAWIWLQTNHFEQPGTSLTASVATVPWPGGAFRGFIAGLWHDGTLYRFATYNGARIERLAADGNRIAWTMRSRHHRLEIVAHRTQAGVLRGPRGADMGGRVPETIRATVDITLSALTQADERPIFCGSGRNAGLEFAGDDTSRLLEER